jgi:MYXO-CTERM domain-containing protein
VLQVSAQAFAAGGVQDIWVRVWNPESKHRAVDKVVYRAAPKGGARHLAVSARVKLLPGTNYVAVDARHMGGAQGQRRIAVYLPKELAGKGGDPSLAVADKRVKKKTASKKRGCGCRSGSSTGGAALLTVVLLLGLRRRRRPRS